MPSFGHIDEFKFTEGDFGVYSPVLFRANDITTDAKKKAVFLSVVFSDESLQLSSPG